MREAQRRSNETKAETQAKLIVALRAFEVKGRPVHADKVGFPGGDHKVGPDGLDIDAGGVHAGHVDRQRYRLGEVAAVVVRLAE